MLQSIMKLESETGWTIHFTELHVLCVYRTYFIIVRRTGIGIVHHGLARSEIRQKLGYTSEGSLEQHFRIHDRTLRGNDQMFCTHKRT